jgi:predicted nucleic acid-binding protein
MPVHRIFLDANVLVTVLCNEYPNYPACARVLSLADDPRFEVYTSPLCLAIGAYFAEKKSGRRVAKKKAALLADKLDPIFRAANSFLPNVRRDFK